MKGLFGRGLFEMIAAQLIFGLAGWMYLESGVQVPDVIFWRCLFGAVTLLGVCWKLGLLGKDAMTLRQFGTAVLAGVLLTGGWLLLFGSMSRASISISTAVYHLHPLILVALGAAFLRDRITPARAVWLAVAFIGMILVVQGKAPTAKGGTDYLTGIFMALGAACSYALVAVLTIRIRDIAPHLIALVQVSTGALMLLPFARSDNIPATPKAWALVIAFGVVGTGLVYVLQYGAYQKLPRHLIGILSFIYPAVAIFVDYAAYDQQLTLLQLIGIGVILLAASSMILGPALTARLGARKP